MRFGKTKGEIWVEKSDFRGNLGGFGGVWTLFGNQPPHPPTFGKDIPKKNVFFLAAPLIEKSRIGSKENGINRRYGY